MMLAGIDSGLLAARLASADSTRLDSYRPNDSLGTEDCRRRATAATVAEHLPLLDGGNYKKVVGGESRIRRVTTRRSRVHDFADNTDLAKTT